MTLLVGDCLELMPTLDAESIDAIVTDPPYGLSFMGKGWDTFGGPLRIGHGKVRAGGREVGGAMKAGDSYDRSLAGQRGFQAWFELVAVEALRVAKPGAHLLAFGGTRTYHRLACAIEDAGWEVRDCLVWAYASGFPKSLDVSKAMDKAAGATREVVGPHPTNTCPGGEWCRCQTDGRSLSPTKHAAATAPATPDAVKWQGWGTALKPAWEPIILARKPLRGTVAANVTEYGTGALNIDGCRIPADPADRAGWAESVGSGPKFTGTAYNGGKVYQSRGEPKERSPLGRWPANLVLTDPIFDGDIEGVVGGGEAKSQGGAAFGRAGYDGGWTPPNDGAIDIGYGDSGTYSRFFLIPKASRSDREPRAGELSELEPRNEFVMPGSVDPSRPTRVRRRNHHPTVKPVALMRHLVRLVTPPGGIVLDPFLGSGTTAIAALEEGFRWVGIEKEPEYAAIVEARLALVQLGLGLGLDDGRPPRSPDESLPARPAPGASDPPGGRRLASSGPPPVSGAGAGRSDPEVKP